MAPPDPTDLPPTAPVPPDLVVSLAAGADAEMRVQRSRFLARVAPAADEAAAKTVIAESGRLHHDARHLCWAWRLGRTAAPAEARSDGGEPAGTAGEPILAALRKAGLVDCVGVVVRWFGGIKLGTGGLARAYGEAATLALAAAPRREILLGRRFSLRFAYPLQKSLLRDLAGRGGRVVDEEYGADVAWTVWLPHSAAEPYAAAVTELSHGAVVPAPVADA